MNGLRIVSRLLTVLALFLVLLQTATGDAGRAIRIYVSPGEICDTEGALEDIQGSTQTFGSCKRIVPN